MFNQSLDIHYVVSCNNIMYRHFQIFQIIGMRPSLRDRIIDITWKIQKFYLESSSDDCLDIGMQ